MTQASGEPSIESRALRGLCGAALRFVAGYLIGLILAPGAAAALVFGAWTAGGRLRPPEPNGPFVSRGVDLSRAGVTSVVWRGPRESLRQTCREGCDDVWFDGAGAPKAVEVSGPGDPSWRPAVRPAGAAR